MGVSTVLFNTVTLIASIIALATSTILALRQSQLMRHANQIPITIDLYNEFRSPDFVSRERVLWSTLGKKGDPRGGFQGMPDDLHNSAYSICAYYQMVGYLVAFGLLDKRLAILPHHYRVIKTWSVVKPYVEAERDLRESKYAFLNFLEDFAVMCQDEDLEQVYLYVRNQAFRPQRWFQAKAKNADPGLPGPSVNLPP